MSQTMRSEVEALLASKGDDEYAGEPVSQLQHALQCARLAEAEGCDDALITAGLLHDVAHLFDDDPDALAAAGIDTAHEEAGAVWLKRWFGPEVTEPVRFHVPAKRWLCAKEPGYMAGLSSASVRSLALQGGPFADEEAEAWLAQPFAKEGLRLRRFDDAAKDPEAVTPTLAHYLDIADKMVKA